MGTGRKSTEQRPILEVVDGDERSKVTLSSVHSDRNPAISLTVMVEPSRKSHGKGIATWLAPSLLIAACGAALWWIARDTAVTTVNEPDSVALASDNTSVLEDSVVSANPPSVQRFPERITTNQRGMSPQSNLGQPGRWNGELERIWGVPGDQPELHFLVRLDTPAAGHTYVEGVCRDMTFAREVLDYLTSEERQEANEKTRNTPGDDVSIHGIVISEDGVAYRIAPRSAPLIGIERLDRTGAVNATAIVHERRPDTTFKEPPNPQCLRAILRVPPSPGPEIRLSGIFQRYDDKTQSVLVGLGVQGRAAEIEVPRSTVPQLESGDRIDVTGQPTGQVRQRASGNMMTINPFLVNGRIVRVNGKAPAVATVTPGQGDAATGDGTEVARRSRRAFVPKRCGDSLLVVSEEGKVALRIGDQWHEFRFPETLLSSVEWCHVAQSGACWICGVGGVVRFDGTYVASWGPAEGLPELDYSHIFEDSEGRIWISAWDGGVSIHEGNRWRNLTTRDGLRANDVNGCTEDSEGRIWIVGDLGVSLFTDDMIETGGIADQLVVNVKSIDHAADGTLYLGYIGGLAIVLPGQSVRNITTDDGLPQRTPQAIFVDSQNRVWLGTWGGGVIQVDGIAGEVLDTHSLPAAGRVRRFAEDERGRIFVGSLEGLWCLEDGRWGKLHMPTAFSRIRVVATIPVAVAEQILGAVGSSGTASQQEVEMDNEPPEPKTAVQSKNPETKPSKNDSPSNLVEYMTKDLKLRSDLRVDNQYTFVFRLPNGVPYAQLEVHRAMSVKSDGAWEFHWRMSGKTYAGVVVNTNGYNEGQLTRAALKSLAHTLASHGLLELPRRVATTRALAKSQHSLVQSIRIRFRSDVYQATIPLAIHDDGKIRETRLEGAASEAKFNRISETICAICPEQFDVDDP